MLLNKDVSYDFALIRAVETRDIDVVNIILKYDSKPSFINKKSDNGSTVLNIATSLNDEQIVKRLLEIPGIDPSLYDSDNKIPLINSIYNLNINIMNMKIDFYGSNIQSQLWQLESAIKTASRMLSSRISKDTKDKLLVILKRILNIEGINPNIREDKHTLLSYACEANELNIVQMLLETKNININEYATINGRTPLMIAILKNNFEIVKLLINDERTNINLRDYSNNTALSYAVSNKLSNAADLLLKSEKFDPDESCLNYAFLISTENGISKQLISMKSIDVNYKYFENDNNYVYETPLTFAVKKK